jgi:putative transcriptional regulator
MVTKKTKALANEAHWLTGQLLIAMPTMPDPRFARTVIYICSHGPTGAMGLVLNRLFGEANFSSLLDQLNIAVDASTPDISIHYGGPVETTRGFVLHTTDYMREGTIRIDDSTGLTATLDILQLIAEGRGPERAMMALGYTGWDSGQLDAEMKANGWLTATADDALLFDQNLDTKWERALAKIGISPSLLSGEAGHT